MVLAWGLALGATGCVSIGQPIDGPAGGSGTEDSGSTSSGPASSGPASSGPESSGGTLDGGSSSSDDAEASGSSDSTGEPLPPVEEGPVGWASVDGEGQAGTYGGAGGDVVEVDTLEALVEALAVASPRIVRVSGAISGLVVIGTSDKTLEGLPGARIDGGIVIEGTAEQPVHNVIVRDLEVVGSGCAGGCTNADAMAIRQAHHVWIDHCAISDGDDGNLDITAEADYVTVSWTRFSYADTVVGPRRSNLIGAADGDVEDADDLRVTMHHCWWADNVAEYMPRVRYGQIHLFDNYYSAVGNDHCIRVGLEADLRVENNYFDGVTRPIDVPVDPTAELLVQGNLALPDPLDDATQGRAFAPPYAYTIDPAAMVPALVMAGAGPP